MRRKCQMKSLVLPRGVAIHLGSLTKNEIYKYDQFVEEEEEEGINNVTNILFLSTRGFTSTVINYNYVSIHKPISFPCSVIDTDVPLSITGHTPLNPNRKAKHQIINYYELGIYIRFEHSSSFFFCCLMAILGI